MLHTPPDRLFSAAGTLVVRISPQLTEQVPDIVRREASLLRRVPNALGRYPCLKRLLVRLMLRSAIPPRPLSDHIKCPSVHRITNDSGAWHISNTGIANMGKANRTTSWGSKEMTRLRGHGNTPGNAQCLEPFGQSCSPSIKPDWPTSSSWYGHYVH